MNIVLKRMKLENFKGIKDLGIEFSANTAIYGANATGKTTIFDAFTWLLFDKDSQNNSSFGIKTHTTDGDTLHGVDHIVSADVEVDGVGINLRKVYSEKWTKKRGSAVSEMAGHTTDYFINDVPLKMKDYQVRINDIISEDLFKLITNPLYFSTLLDKNKRRETIIGLIDDVSNEDVLGNNEELIELTEGLSKYTLDELRAMNKATMQKINKEIQELPVRIDELNSQIREYDFDALAFQKRSKETSLKMVKKEMLTLEESKAEYQKKLDAINQKRKKANDIKYKHDEDYEKKKREAHENWRAIVNDLEMKKRQRSKLELEIQHVRNKIEQLNDRKSDLAKKWEELYQTTFDGSLMCPTCGVEYSEDKKQEIISKFNENKIKRLDDIEKEGHALKARIEEFEIVNSRYIKQLNTLNEEIENCGEVKMQEVKRADYSLKYYELLKEIEQDEKALSSRDDISDQEKQEKIKELERSIGDLNTRLAAKQINEEIKEKINQYMDDEKKLSKIYAEAERMIYLTDLFITTKVEMISEKINEMFSLVNFKLFDKQINGGIKETCEITVDGVPYSDLNNAMKINAGIDVINTLSEHMKAYAPIFVDNAESVNKVAESKSQMVKLIVSEDKSLRVERR